MTKQKFSSHFRKRQKNKWVISYAQTIAMEILEEFVGRFGHITLETKVNLIHTSNVCKRHNIVCNVIWFMWQCAINANFEFTLTKKNNYYKSYFCGSSKHWPLINQQQCMEPAICLLLLSVCLTHFYDASGIIEMKLYSHIDYTGPRTVISWYR